MERKSLEYGTIANLGSFEIFIPVDSELKHTLQSRNEPFVAENRGIVLQNNPINIFDLSYEGINSEVDGVLSDMKSFGSVSV